MAQEAIGNGFAVVRTKTGVGVAPVAVHCGVRQEPPPEFVATVELRYMGRLMKVDHFRSWDAWRDCLFEIPDMRLCAVTVKRGTQVLVDLPVEGEESILPFMRRQFDQVHITENYVSVPPALTITDEHGSIWTVGFQRAPKHKSPEGEFAFPVLRDGVDMGEIASRIERQGGKIRILTADGWKTWTGRSFF